MVFQQSTFAAKVPSTLVLQSRDGLAAALVSHGAPSPSKIAFSVAYKRLEYVNFVTLHLAATLIENGRLGAGESLPFYARYLVTVVGSVAFFLKRRKMPVCHFEIDAIGIRRKAAGRLLVLPWSEVLSVHCYPPGLLVAKNRGAMPLPFRCLTPEQIDLLGNFVAAWRSAQLKTASTSS